MEGDQAVVGRTKRILRQRKWSLVALALLLVVGAVVYLVRPGTDRRAGSVALEEGPVRAREPLASYRIDSRLEVYAADVNVSRESAIVRRPFEAKVGDTAYAFGRYSIAGQVLAVQPGAPDPDRRPDSVLGEAARDGYADARERRRIAGRICRIYRIGAGSEAIGIPRLADSDENYREVCVDGTGLILEEVTFTDGEITRRRIATRVIERPKVSKSTFDVGDVEGDPKLVGSVKELEPDSRLPGADFWELPKAPKGFTFNGRYAIVPPGQPGFSDPTARGSILAFLSEVWTNGIDVIVIDQGAAASSKPFASDPNALKVKAGDIGKGELRYGLRESEVRFITEGTHFVRVRGTVEPSRLLALARSLEAKPGGPLRVKN